ncbi:MAG: hypothetical protein CMJ13_03455 [Pelagibacterales bacterium]|nr:hypothetical protein [Pelagibacterales bacterium]
MRKNMSAEINKMLCAVLSAILVWLLSSFIGELLYHPKKVNKLAYEIIEDKPKESIKSDNENIVNEVISTEEIEKLIINANLEKGEKFVTKNCSACHSFTLPIKNKIGPSLATILDREIGSMGGYKYSKSFQELKEEWSYKNLYFFLEKPKIWAPGTKMSYRGISKKEDLINVLKYLSHTSKLNES